MSKHGQKPHKQDTKRASIFIAVFSVVGLTVCFVVASNNKQGVPYILYAIFGGGILGTDSVLKLLRAVFRIDNDRK